MMPQVRLFWKTLFQSLILWFSSNPSPTKVVKALPEISASKSTSDRTTNLTGLKLQLEKTGSHLITDSCLPIPPRKDLDLCPGALLFNDLHFSGFTNLLCPDSAVTSETAELQLSHLEDHQARSF